MLSGIIPLHMVLSLNGNQILQDWEYCRELIKGKISYNLFKKEDKNKLVNIPRRRHFLWLACASSLYMYKNWTTLAKEKMEEQINWIKKIFDREDLDIRELIKMNNEIMIIIEKNYIQNYQYLLCMAEKCRQFARVSYILIIAYFGLFFKQKRSVHWSWTCLRMKLDASKRL